MSLTGFGRVQEKQGWHHQPVGFYLFGVAIVRVSLVHLGQGVDFSRTHSMYAPR
ncbi:hypothetical protein [Microseira sp. BLCC-F43]|uniref:hypothetical protein n=1 Tax=Microseira sp. BLCC-F43 TaxID=3153602 RepID=UPI0035BB7E38